MDNQELTVVVEKALEEIQKVNFGLQSNISSDLMAIDIREALYHFGMITGEVTNDELLGNIFAIFVNPRAFCKVDQRTRCSIV